MKKILIFIAIALLLAMGIIYFLGSDKSGESVVTPEDSYIIGKIYSIDGSRILIAEGLEGEEYDGDISKLRGNAIWFTIDQETEITRFTSEVIGLEDLEAGEIMAEVWSRGLILESYPAQGVAAKIKLITEETKKESAGECFIGGCSGELCISDPETMSTCELLPGMECLNKEMSCQLVENECDWVLSEAAAKCFLAVKKEQGEAVAETRMGHFFQKAENILN
jgi:eight-cysteine-cluster-containing protein